MLIFLLIVLMVTATGAVLTAQIRKDGYGSRPAPRSHYDYFETNSLAR